LRDVLSFLVPGTTLAGLVVGGALDPIGQRLADRSQAEDDRRRAEQQASVAEGDPGQGQSRLGTEVANESGTGVGAAHLLSSGRSPGRTIGAALVTGALFAVAAHHFGSHLVLAPFCVFFAMLVVVSITDLSHRLVPRRLIYFGVALIVPLLVATSAVDHAWRSLSGAAIGGAVAFALFFAVWWFVPRGMGFGDVRLAGSIGLTVGYLSLLHVYLAFLVGFVVGTVFGLAMMAVSSTGRKTRIPFAPSLAAGAVVAVIWGGHLAQSLFHAGS
jgi:leader peptidase (prepilin peptidase) / N-methyltransferase